MSLPCLRNKIRWSGGTDDGLPFLSGFGGVESVANAVSGDGSVVVG